MSPKTLMSPNPRLIKVVGQDPSLRNWGLATGTYDLDSKKLTIQKVAVTNAVLPTGKLTRQNSLDLESAYQLYQSSIAAAEGAHAVFVEVPVGSQSARAMASYGICVGVLGALRANGIPFFEVNPLEVKLAGAGTKTATKQDMISWAMASHPEAPWPTYKQNGTTMVSEAKAEHMADAVAAIYAGLACNAFKQMLPFIAAQTMKEKNADPT
jgi:Holliday junction resolvasome RuvABC endonuclease subunit